MNATTEYKAAVFETLEGITGDVHRSVPQKSTFPYTVLGPTTEVSDDDLDGAEGAELTITLFPWDRGPSAARLNTMIGQIHARLHNAEIESGGLKFFVWLEIKETFDEKAEDGVTLQRGRLVYRAKTYE